MMFINQQLYQVQRVSPCHHISKNITKYRMIPAPTPINVSTLPKKTVKKSPLTVLSSNLILEKSQSRTSYLKAFKKHYIDKLIENKINAGVCRQAKPLQEIRLDQIINQKDKQNSHLSNNKTEKEQKRNLHPKHQETIGNNFQDFSNGLNVMKISNFVKNSDSELEEVLYGSISQFEREILENECSQFNNASSNALEKENRFLKNSLNKLKMILKDKLEGALKKNKDELTLMFEEYSELIKKLLQDKEKMTCQLEAYEGELEKKNEQAEYICQEYQNKIRLIVEGNSEQISNTKHQIEEFLDIIIQYEEEAKEELKENQKLKSKIHQLEDHITALTLKGNQDSLTKRRHTQSNQSSQKDEMEEKYAEKIEVLLEMLEKSQQQNMELISFLQNCKCSSLKANSSEINSLNENICNGSMKEYYKKQMEELELETSSTQRHLREALRKKDLCIDRLNLIIEELRKERYESVDHITQQQIRNTAHPRN